MARRRRWERRHTGIGAAALVGFLAAGACSGPEGGAGGATMVRDSAGVHIVEARAPVWGEGDGWSLSQEPILEIGSQAGEESFELYDVTGAVRLSGGSVVVLNNGTKSVRLFGSQGEFLSEFGGDGNGPGKFRDVTLAHVLPGDTLLIWDNRLRRYSLFTGDGDHVLSLPLAGVEGGPVIGLWPLQDGRLLGQPGTSLRRMGEGISPGIHRDQAPLLLFDREGALQDTVGLFPGVETAVIEMGGRLGYGAAPYAKTTHFDVSRGLVVLARASQVEVEVWDPHGSLLSIFRAPEADLSLGPEDRDFYTQSLMESVESPQERQGAEEILRSMPFPETLAAVSDLRVDPLGNAWVRTGRHIPIFRPSREWTVFSPEGFLLGTLSLPPDFTLLEIGVEEILGVWKNEMGAEFVRAFALERGP